MCIRDRVQRKSKRGLADNDDVQNAKSTLLMYREQYRLDKQSHDRIMKELNIYMNIGKYTPDRNEFDNYFNVSSGIKYKRVDFTETRSCQIYNLSKKKLKYYEDVAGNKLLPQLNLIGSVKLKSQEDSFSSSLSSMNDLDYSVGFSLSYPIGNTDAKSKIKDAKLAVDEINREYEISENNYEKSLDSVITSIEGSRDVLGIKTDKLNALKSKYVTEKKKYNQARLNLKFVTDTAISITSEEINRLHLKNQIIDLYFDYRDLTE